MDKVKQQKVAAMSTLAIKRILGTLQSPEDREPSAEYPLGGIVHIEGIGQVKVTELREELARRS